MTALFLYTPSGLVAEYNASGGLIREYHYWPAGTWMTNPLFQRAGGQVYYYQNDHLGTPRRLVTNAGAVVWEAEYTAFGQAHLIKESVTNNLRFPGQYFDQETGLHHNYFRDYDPATGRYIQSDPLGLYDGPNTYTYVYSNPINYTDPTGEFGVVGGIIGGVIDLGLQLAQNGGNFNCVNWWQVAGSAALGAVGAGVGAKLAGVAGKGKVFSHWVPARAKKWVGFGGKLGKKFLKSGNKYNGNYVSQVRHYKHDPFAYGNVKGQWRSWGAKWPRAIQQIDRIPNVYKGAAGGGVAGNTAGNASGSGDCGCN